MKTKLLDLNAYGVSELSNAEMREVDGGWLREIFDIIWKSFENMTLEQSAVIRQQSLAAGRG